MHPNMSKLLSDLYDVYEQNEDIIRPSTLKVNGEQISGSPYGYWRMPCRAPIGYMLNMYDGKRDKYWTTYIKGEEPDKGKIIYMEAGNTFYHSHDYFEFTYIIDGEYSELVINDDVVLRGGDLTLLDLKSIHRVQTNAEQSDIIFLSFSKEFLTQELMNVCSVDIRSFFETAVMNKSESGQVMLFRAKDPESVYMAEGLLADIVGELNGRRVGYESVVNGYMARFLSILSDRYIREVRTAVGSEQKLLLFHEITSYIKEHLDTVTVEMLEQVYHYSRNYYSRLFREIAGCTYSEYLRRIRLERAEELLCTTELPVQDISRFVGYENRSYFYRIFKNKYGVTPSEYRSKNYVSISKR